MSARERSVKQKRLKALKQCTSRICSDVDTFKSYTVEQRRKKRKAEWNDDLYVGHRNKKQKTGKNNKKKNKNVIYIDIVSDSDENEDIDIDITSSPKIKQFKISENIKYTSRDKILFIGEMDFSLSASMVKVIGGYNFVCTSYYDTISNKFNVNDETFIKTANDNINNLKYNGSSIMFGIDGTKLNTYSFKLSWGFKREIKLFDKIIFGFPYCCYAQKTIKKSANQIFMSKIFKSCKNLLKQNGELHVILVSKQIKAWNINYDDWNMVKCKTLTKMSDFNDTFPGYTPRDTKGFPWQPEPSALYVFQPN